ncbi:uncharacterized protein LOC136095525 [Hydra vulgaris]|uniref:uncharacterized protein LOC136095525 n=1 Tax=Hydra vulgaris TaxID=6087 RepID=UPI0032E9FA9A
MRLVDKYTQASIFPFIKETIIDNENLTNVDTKVNEIYQVSDFPIYSIFNTFNTHVDNNNKSQNLPINSYYINVDDLKCIAADKSSFNVFHINISSLLKHFDDLVNLLQSTKLEFDIIGISETRLNKNRPQTSNITLNGYSHEDTPSESHASGALLYINNRLAYKPRNDLLIYKPKELKSIFIEIINPKKSNIIVGCIYRHPKMSLDNFLSFYLNPLLKNLTKENKTIFILGDFNIDLLKCDTNLYAKDFLDSLTSNYILPHIIHPTRICKTSKTIIDNIFSNIKSNKYKAGNLTTTISDHLPQFLIAYNILKSPPSKKLLTQERNLKSFNEVSFKHDFHKTIIDKEPKYTLMTVLSLLRILSPILICCLISTRLLESLTKKNLNSRLNHGYLMNSSILFSTKTSSSKNILDLKIKQIKPYKYKIFRNKLQSKLKESKKNYFDNYFTKNIKHIKATWKGIKNIINIKSNSHTTPNIIVHNNITITNPFDICNTFNNYFTGIGRDVQATIPSSMNHFTYYLSNPAQKSFFIKPTDEHEISKIIDSLDSYKASGPNGLPVKILKLLKTKLSRILSNIFNTSFSSGIFPENLKTAKVIPIFKNDSKLIMSNYRPISLLSNIDKILERLMFNRIYEYFNENKLFCDLQFGFRTNYSTSLALPSLTEKIKNSLDEGMFGCGIFIDLQKAFDTVDVDILLYKLSYSWFKSFLTNRTQLVSIGGVNSNLNDIKVGVPQGSILGPLLFLIYINYMSKALKFCRVKHFADDTNLLYFNKSVKKSTNMLTMTLRNYAIGLMQTKFPSTPKKLI